MAGRRTRTASKPPLSLGIAGSGEVAAKTLTGLLDDLIDGRELEALYIPVTSADYTDEVAAVVAWANENKVPYVTISDEAASKDKEMKEVIAGGTDDYDAGESAGKAIVELLAGDDEEPVADGRLLMFLNAEDDDDAETFEEAADLEVAAFDLCNGLEAIQFGDDDAPAAEEPAEEPEPEEEPAPTRRGRRKAADVNETESAQAPKAALRAVPDAPELSEEELLKLTLVELKKRAKAADPKKNTTESLRGLGKPEVVALLLAVADGDEADEAQADLPSPATASEAVDGDDTDPEAETREAVFARLRANRERAEAISINLTRSLRIFAEEGTPEEGAERASAALASALMLFAEFVVSEVRKPKSPGRPRKDGTEAQPRPAAPVEPAKAPRRRRSSSSS